MWLLSRFEVCLELTPPAFSTGFSTYMKTGDLLNADAVLLFPGLLRIASLALAVSESTQTFSFLKP